MQNRHSDNQSGVSLLQTFFYCTDIQKLALQLAVFQLPQGKQANEITTPLSLLSIEQISKAQGTQYSQPAHRRVRCCPRVHEGEEVWRNGRGTVEGGGDGGGEEGVKEGMEGGMEGGRGRAGI